MYLILLEQRDLDRLTMRESLLRQFEFAYALSRWLEPRVIA